ncbi:MAG: xanthine dehydrogenase family protein molybdopterin-binding subunit [Pigmentiphaga sp.]|uniref:xanthine dehydrogenase family protein molybdopterin-binding subunit n=1 Tax=Pigmentiphaga sp. TaxID=1977564 RepID=UPI0029BD0FEE|nr:xanthine dehydrogenase family protein molybdopterin-binding subunit [Pigmentiphaga sp.]MDX3905218.1 xanthine dehydrogenase family protein molybdopterin-binding subunit [Pigmentiphaga sp.]
MDRFIGQPLPRAEDVRLVSGQGRYTDDMNLPDQVYGVFVRSPHPHAVIRAIDAQAALEAPGVLAVLRGQDYLDDGHRGMDHIPNPADAVAFRERAFTESLTGAIFNQRHLPLAVDRVRHVGEPVVLVVARSVREARDACDLVEIDYEPLPAVVDAVRAMDADAPQLWDGAPGNLCFQTRIGDEEAVRQAFARARHVVRQEFRNSRIVNCQMEPRSVLGSYDARTDEYLLIAGSQGVTRQQLCMADALGIPPERLRVVSHDVGGGFGPRSCVNPDQLAVLWAARRVGRPVKWTSDRNEAFLADYQGRDQVIRAAMAFDEQGRILAIDNEVIGNVGAHTVSYVPLANGSRIMTTVYHVPVATALLSAVLTNTPPTGPYRGAGRPEATHVMERMLDIAARQIGMDRIELRRRNLIQPQQMPYRSPMGLTYDSGQFAANMERALVVCEWDGREARKQAALKRGKWLGVGLANYVESPVGAPRERIELVIAGDGRVDCVVGTQSTGQGHETTFRQVLADELGVPFESIGMRTGDTAFVKVGGGSHSDRSMRLVGHLIGDAAAQLRSSGAPVAALLLACDEQSLRFEQGRFVDPATGRSAGLFEVAARIERDGMPGQPEVRRYAAAAEFNGRIPAHPTGTAVCELEVDPETGDVEIVRYTSIDDVGRPINPQIVEGQVHGGLAQGIGQALLEDYQIDPESGQVLSGSYMDYGVARAEVMPPRLDVELTEDPTHGNALGVKGGGESGITPATAAIFNALADALEAVTTEELPMPATPPVIWETIRRGRVAR